MKHDPIRDNWKNNNFLFTTKPNILQSAFIMFDCKRKGIVLKYVALIHTCSEECVTSSVSLTCKDLSSDTVWVAPLFLTGLLNSFLQSHCTIYPAENLLTNELLDFTCTDITICVRLRKWTITSSRKSKQLSPKSIIWISYSLKTQILEQFRLI